jgi:hypothetical protein
VAHTCNPGYSGGRDQKDYSSKPAQANSSGAGISKNPITNWAGGVVQGEGPEFKPQYCKKKSIKSSFSVSPATTFKGTKTLFKGSFDWEKKHQT